ncbi:hypothetical protein AB6O49_00595 [Streptomyces sp. SBR177]
MKTMVVRVVVSYGAQPGVPVVAKETQDRWTASARGWGGAGPSSGA